MTEVRGRLSHGFNRARLRLEVRRSVTPLVVLLIGAAIGLGCWFVLARNVGPYLYKPTREVRLELDDASGIVAGRQEVRFRGIPAGVIAALDNDGPVPVVTLKLFRRFGPIYRDAKATLRPNTAIEDMYVDILDRGTKAAGESSAADPIPARQIESSVQPEDVLQAFEPDVRVHMAAVLDELGGGLAGRGDELRDAFQRLVPVVDLAGRLSAQLADRRTMTRELTHNLSVLTGELGQRENELRTLVSAAGATFETLAGGSRDLDATLHRLPPTLSAVETSFTAVRGVLPAVDRALTSLRPVAGRLPGALTAIRQLGTTATPALTALRKPVAHLIPLADALVPAAANLQGTVDALLPQVPAIDHVAKTVAGCPVAIQGFFQWTPSTLKFGDARGTIIRGDAALGLESAGTTRDPNVRALPSCAPGAPVGGIAGHGGDLRP